MPKMKTKSAVKKRFWITGSGKIKRGHAGKRHNLTKRTKDRKRAARNTTLVSRGDDWNVRQHMPYGSK